MIGDGYTDVVRCEFADEDKYLGHTPDSPPVECDFKDEESS